MADLVKIITTTIVLSLIMIFFHAKIKKQSMLQSIKDFKEGAQELFGS